MIRDVNGINIPLLGRQMAAPYVDRLGSNRLPYLNNQYVKTSYYPYGEANVSGYAFATYSRDGFTGLDYAQNRYYVSYYGRFLTPDPSSGSNAADPANWNRYSYLEGDPINHIDPRGTDSIDPSCVTTVWLGGCDRPSYGGGGGCIPGTPPGPEDPGSPTICFPDPFAGTPVSAGNSVDPQSMGYGIAQADAALVAEGILTDCQGLAAYASAMASLLGSPSAFIQSFGVFVPITTETSAAGIAANTHPIAFVGASSGFDPQYQNTNGDPSDQTHHFAAFFELGYRWGVVAATGIGELREAIEAAFAKLFGGYGYNEGDVELAYQAAAMGGALKNHVLAPDDIAGTIRSQLCQH